MHNRIEWKRFATCDNGKLPIRHILFFWIIKSLHSKWKQSQPNLFCWPINCRRAMSNISLVVSNHLVKSNIVYFTHHSAPQCGISTIAHQKFYVKLLYIQILSYKICIHRHMKFAIRFYFYFF